MENNVHDLFHAVSQALVVEEKKFEREQLS
ncbi:MAG: hypothetical protein UX04_C0006G0015 [Microgenomates group bacterium GW2011_GWF2_45_18]|nr:MAG: hypothetical protein UW18_C0006G0015 [Microgenomates group bacterium GW2011_GWF1_44_10]KKU01480.1 MAG: hypothetical protein UX04_C0006G0015 [Microgenomates group bacterium GW2011_GWF2_45_18]